MRYLGCDKIVGHPVKKSRESQLCGKCRRGIGAGGVGRLKGKLDNIGSTLKILQSSDELFKNRREPAVKPTGAGRHDDTVDLMGRVTTI